MWRSREDEAGVGVSLCVCVGVSDNNQHFVSGLDFAFQHSFSGFIPIPFLWKQVFYLERHTIYITAHNFTQKTLS